MDLKKNMCRKLQDKNKKKLNKKTMNEIETELTKDQIFFRKYASGLRALLVKKYNLEPELLSYIDLIDALKWAEWHLDDIWIDAYIDRQKFYLCNILKISQELPSDFYNRDDLIAKKAIRKIHRIIKKTDDLLDKLGVGMDGLAEIADDSDIDYIFGLNQCLEDLEKIHQTLSDKKINFEDQVYKSKK